MSKLFSIRLLLGIALCSRQVAAQQVTPLQAEKPALYDLLITNARVVDGTGNPWFHADVAIKDGKIARVGHIETTTAKQTLDAQNKVLAPGFIDVHTHVEGIFNTPQAENFVRMGVTSLVTGNCGSSTTNVGEFLGQFAQKPLAVNVGTLVAHGSVRRAVMGLERRAPSATELESMKGPRRKSHERGSRWPFDRADLRARHLRENR